CAGRPMSPTWHFDPW
nr:immunoglobulin heavy chain junction region [Macaca mulatta]MOV90649.1 immunoglobulin heavy chain junction region [Macaca mulatta]